LRHGIVAKSAEWPASLYATFTVPGGTAACTAALIGPQVMLTAAHCVPPSGKVTIRFNNRSYETKCTQHSRYGSDASADFALCKLSQPVSQPAQFQFPGGRDCRCQCFDLRGRTAVLAGLGVDVHLNEYVQRPALRRPEAIERYVARHIAGENDYSFQLWSLLMLELWFREFID